MTEKLTTKKELALISCNPEIDNLRKTFSNPDLFDGELKLLTKYNELSKKKKLSQKQEKERKEIKSKIGLMYGLENGIWIYNLGHEKDYPMLARIRQRIIRDYNCQTSLELILADSIVACYWRITRAEMQLTKIVDKADGSWSFNQLKVNIMKELNKEIDLANRRMNMNIVLLKEMKQPPIKVNVRTNNAFIGQNQQFNNNQNKKKENQ